MKATNWCVSVNVREEDVIAALCMFPENQHHTSCLGVGCGACLVHCKPAMAFMLVLWQDNYTLTPDLTFMCHIMTVATKAPAARKWVLCCVPVVAQFDPDNLFVVGLLPCPAITAGPRPLRHLHLQTFRVEGSWAWVAAQQLASYLYVCVCTQVCVRVCVYVCRCRCVCVHALWGNWYAKRGGVFD